MPPYTPPHLRKEGVSHDKPDLPPELLADPTSNLRLDEIANYFWPFTNEGNTGHDVESPCNEQQSRTLHGSADSPDELAYVIIFHGANPEWKTDNIIFTKSSLDLLSSTLLQRDHGEASMAVTNGTEDIHKPMKNRSTDNSENQPDQARLVRPIAVFKQTPSKTETTGFQFEGWYNVEQVEFHEPGSADLVRMLERKWAKKNRFGALVKVERPGFEWQKSLGYKWAEMKLVPDEKAREEKGVPDIERIPEKQATKSNTPKKSVNEMLAEMRLKDTEAGAIAAVDGV